MCCAAIQRKKDSANIGFSKCWIAQTILMFADICSALSLLELGYLYHLGPVFKFQRLNNWVRKAHALVSQYLSVKWAGIESGSM